MSDDLQLSEHAVRNREMWNADAPRWVDMARTAWSTRSPYWGMWSVPEEQVHILPDVRGLDVLDLGCGTGFHLPLFAGTARSVTGVEPHPDLASIARRRVRRLGNVTVLEGSATSLPLPDASVDVMHARWAYFFGPGCEPGLDELDRVMRTGGRAFVIDNDPTRSTFGGWFRRGYPKVDPGVVARFWQDEGWERHPIETAWTFDSREELEAVVRIEFTAEVAEEVLAGHQGTEVDYAVNVWSRGY